VKNKISSPEKKLRRLELSEIDPDIIIVASKVETGYDPERLQRLQMTRDLKRVVKFLEKLTGEKN